METPLDALAGAVDADCTRCGACRARCGFLQEAGTPGEVAHAIASGSGALPDVYHCSLCGLCGAVCPEGVRPEELFLAMRQARVRSGAFDAAPYSPILAFERLGDSALFSLLRLPAGGETVLFPGCGLCASRPKTVRRLYTALRRGIPDLGVALGCCLKPSRDLGRADFFAERFGSLRDRLVDAGVRRVLTACPNCHKVFMAHGGPLTVTTVYEVLAGAKASPGKAWSHGDGAAEVVVHDPCSLREGREAQDAVRSLVRGCGLAVAELPDGRGRTVCCGEGGMVKFVRPGLADRWASMRVGQAEGRTIVTSCAGCAGFLGGAATVEHVLDGLFDSRPRGLLRPPFTYAARLLLKAWFMRVVR
jgi:Fe-S oxidoreductase